MQFQVFHRQPCCCGVGSHCHFQASLKVLGIMLVYGDAADDEGVATAMSAGFIGKQQIHGMPPWIGKLLERDEGSE
jgi:hypothetical protein